MSLHDNIRFESNPVVSILMPYCVELNEDVFLQILKSVIWHSKMDDRYRDALKSGMTSKTLCVESSDLKLNWKELTSKSQKLRQYQLLGYWATHNYPALGKKLFGDTWKVLQRQSIEVIGSEAMSSDAVDAEIIRKMKIRSIELNVCKGTLTKLRRLVVETPKNIGQYNGIQISPKMKSFDIQHDHIEKCWETLKYGNLSMSELQNDFNQLDQNGIIRTEGAEAATSSPSDAQLVPAAKRLGLYATDSTRGKEIIRQSGYHMVPLVKRMRLDVANNTEANDRSGPSGSGLIHAIDQTQTDTNAANQLTSDSFPTLVLDMRREIEHLTERLNSATQMKAADESLLKENDMLKEHVKANASLINSLQQGFDSSTKWYQMMELSFQKQVEESSKNLAETEKKKSELFKKNGSLKNELDELKNFISSSQKHSEGQIQVLTKHLVEVERVNFETTEKNAKLDQELRDLKDYSARVDSKALHQKIQDLNNSLFESERSAVNISKKNEKMEQELSEVKQELGEVKQELGEVKQELGEVKQELGEVTQEFGEIKRELGETKEKFGEVEQELGDVKLESDDVKQQRDNLKQELGEMKRELSEMKHELGEAKEKFDVVKQELGDVKQERDDAKQELGDVRQELVDVKQELVEAKQDATNIRSLYENQIHYLNENVEMSDKITKLEAEVSQLKKFVATKNEEVIEARKAEKNLYTLKHYATSMATDLQNQIQTVENKLADTQRMNIELTSKNGELEMELRRWKSDSAPVVQANNKIVVPEQAVEFNRMTPIDHQELIPAQSGEPKKYGLRRLADKKKQQLCRLSR